MKSLAVLLIVLGIAALIYGGITWTSKKSTVEAGPLQFEVTESQSFPVVPVIGGLMLIGGIVLMVVDNNKKPAAK